MPSNDPEADAEAEGEGETVEVRERDLRELYSTLADATMAAATGDPNRCSELAAEAKEQVKDLHTEARKTDE